MKPFGYIIAFCLICAAVKAAVMALELGVALATVIGACTRPRETFGFLAFVLITNLAEKHPLLLLGTIATVSLASMLCAGAGKSE